MERRRYSGAVLARHPERTRLDELLESIRDGRSSTLLLSGGAGVGKTTLLNYLVQNSAGVQILGVTGIQSEIELPYAALHQLCRPLMSTIDSLPDPLQDALETTFGMRGGSLPDKFLLGLATLSLLSDASRAGPILCVVDDAQWLDSVSAEVLGFVARRLDAEGVGMAFAARTPHHIPGLEGVPLLALTGLERRDAHELLLSLAHGATDPGALHRILDEADGNPLVLMESVRALTREELATGILLADAPSQLTRIEEQFRQRVILLPPDTQQLLLIAAAEPLGDARAIQFAAAKSGIDSAAVRPAIEAGLCEPGVGIRFRHPLVR
ncbi:MAG: hypothetical protein K0R99_4691, partial [Microbacterium sp.]|nr:hypothetical protein [Microbacterium sp.]